MIALNTDKLLCRVEAGIGWVTFNQPERRNAVSLEMWRALCGAMEALEADDDVRVIILTGAGGKAFVAGADISEFEAHRASSEQFESYGETARRGFSALTACTKPVIAMIRGYCIGGGLVIALAADVRFATSASRFGVPAAKLGLGYDYPGVAALARLVGTARAADILYSARHLNAEEALCSGLVEFVVEDGELEEHVLAYASAIADNAPLTIKAVKAALKAYARDTRPPTPGEVDRLVARCFDSEDYREGRRAFLEKRKPRFTGR